MESGFRSGELTTIVGFNPDWVSPPGHTIEDAMEERQISKGDFCRLCNFSLTFLNYLLVGDALINEEIADTLSRVLGSSKEFWLKREETFRRDSERLGKDVWWTYNENGERELMDLKPETNLNSDLPGLILAFDSRCKEIDREGLSKWGYQYPVTGSFTVKLTADTSNFFKSLETLRKQFAITTKELTRFGVAVGKMGQLKSIKDLQRLGRINRKSKLRGEFHKILQKLEPNLRTKLRNAIGRNK